MHTFRLMYTNGYSLPASSQALTQVTVSATCSFLRCFLDFIIFLRVACELIFCVTALLRLFSSLRFKLSSFCLRAACTRNTRTYFRPFRWQMLDWAPLCWAAFSSFQA